MIYDAKLQISIKIILFLVPIVYLYLKNKSLVYGKQYYYL